MTLIELLVAVAIVVMVTAMIAGGIASNDGLKMRNAAKRLSLTYEQLGTEAVLRNKSFRITYDLDNSRYEFQVGDASATIFADPESKERYEEEQEDLRARLARKLDDGKTKSQKEILWEVAAGLDGKVDLPGGVYIKSVYTPQMEEPVEYVEEGDREDLEEGETNPRMVYSHIFANGFAEMTIVQIALLDDPMDGYTLVVDPLSGEVQLHTEFLEPDDVLDFYPDEGPELSL